MHDDRIPMDDMVILVWDGPNVNKTISKDEWPDITGFLGVIDLGFCTIHTVHSAFGNGIEKYGKHIDLLCLDRYS